MVDSTEWVVVVDVRDVVVVDSIGVVDSVVVVDIS